LRRISSLTILRIARVASLRRIASLRIASLRRIARVARERSSGTRERSTSGTRSRVLDGVARGASSEGESSGKLESRRERISGGKIQTHVGA